MVPTLENIFFQEAVKPAVFLQQGADEVFGLVRDVFKTLLVERVVGRRHQRKGLSVAAPLEGRFSAEPATQTRIVRKNSSQMKNGIPGQPSCLMMPGLTK